MAVGSSYLWRALRIARVEKAGREERVRQAYKFNPPSPGSARFAENRDLRKAGLFGGKGVPIGYSPRRSPCAALSGQGPYFDGGGCTYRQKGATLLVNALL